MRAALLLSVLAVAMTLAAAGLVQNGTRSNTQPVRQKKRKTKVFGNLNPLTNDRGLAGDVLAGIELQSQEQADLHSSYVFGATIPLEGDSSQPEEVWKRFLKSNATDPENRTNQSEPCSSSGGNGTRACELQRLNGTGLNETDPQAPLQKEAGHTEDKDSPHEGTRVTRSPNGNRRTRKSTEQQCFGCRIGLSGNSSQPEEVWRRLLLKLKIVTDPQAPLQKEAGHTEDKDSPHEVDTCYGCTILLEGNSSQPKEVWKRLVQKLKIVTDPQNRTNQSEPCSSSGGNGTRACELQRLNGTGLNETDPQAPLQKEAGHTEDKDSPHEGTRVTRSPNGNRRTRKSTEQQCFGYRIGLSGNSSQPEEVWRCVTDPQAPLQKEAGHTEDKDSPHEGTRVTHSPNEKRKKKKKKKPIQKGPPCFGCAIPFDGSEEQASSVQDRINRLLQLEGEQQNRSNQSEPCSSSGGNGTRACELQRLNGTGLNETDPQAPLQKEAGHTEDKDSPHEETLVAPPTPDNPVTKPKKAKRKKSKKLIFSVSVPFDGSEEQASSVQDRINRLLQQQAEQQGEEEGSAGPQGRVRRAAQPLTRKPPRPCPGCFAVIGDTSIGVGPITPSSLSLVK
ncbi:uncharacterized protein LOC136761672 isoform X2 [Amia ocellicauda]|uniref:uncharacterized protein LOC136761672 isoform X2 n=1 Tax=Amia ocellicauda TaxID=2972642 RepID=UPI00346441B3